MANSVLSAVGAVSGHSKTCLRLLVNIGRDKPVPVGELPPMPFDADNLRAAMQAGRAVLKANPALEEILYRPDIVCPNSGRVVSSLDVEAKSSHGWAYEMAHDVLDKLDKGTQECDLGIDYRKLLNMWARVGAEYLAVRAAVLNGDGEEKRPEAEGDKEKGAVPEGYIWWTATKAAGHIGVHPRTISNWIRDGRLGFQNNEGTRYLFSMEELDRHRDAQNVKKKRTSK